MAGEFKEIITSPTLSDAISSLQNASSCKSCGRIPHPCPSSSSSDHRVVIDDDHCRSEEGNYHHSQHSMANDTYKISLHFIEDADTEYYHGPLFMSQSCGHFFCARCWKEAERKEFRGDRSSDDFKPACCPVCQSPTKNVAPILPFLVKESKAKKYSIHPGGNGGLNTDDSVLKNQQHLSFLEKNSQTGDQNCNQLDQQLGKLLGMLQQFTRGFTSRESNSWKVGKIHRTTLNGNDVKPSHYSDKSHNVEKGVNSKIYENVENSSAQKDGDDTSHSDEPKSSKNMIAKNRDNEDRFTESEVPGTCLSRLAPLIHDKKISTRPTDSSKPPIYDRTGRSQESTFDACRQETNTSEVLGALLDTWTNGSNESEVPGTLLPLITVAQKFDTNPRDIRPRSSEAFSEDSEVGDCSNNSNRFERINNLSNEHFAMELSADNESVGYGGFDRQSFQDDSAESEVPGTFSHRYEEKKSENNPVHQTQPETDYDAADRDSILRRSLSQSISFSEGNESSVVDCNDPGSKLPESEVPGTLVNPKDARIASESLDYYSNQLESSLNPRKSFKSSDPGTPEEPRKAQFDHTALDLTSPSTHCKRDDVCNNSNKEKSISFGSSSKRAMNSIIGVVPPCNHGVDPVISQLTRDVHDVHELDGIDHTKNKRNTDASCAGNHSNLTSYNGDPLDFPTKNQKIITSAITRSLPCHSPIREAKSIPHLYIAFDILDPVEAGALKALHDQGLCRVVNSVHKLPCTKQHDMNSNKKRGQLTSAPQFRPFPAILVTDAIDRPAFDAVGDEGPTDSKTVSICPRTYTYLKALALGAYVIDARWLIDSRSAETWMKISSYRIWGDLETYNNLKLRQERRKSQTADLTKNEVFYGITFHLMQGEDERTESHTSYHDDNSQLQLTTQSLTKNQSKSLIECLGGTVSESILSTSRIILVPDSMPLNQIKNSFIVSNKGTQWSIRSSVDAGMLDLNSMRSSANRDENKNQVFKLPILRSKWLEDSICTKSFGRMERYCIGVICFSESISHTSLRGNLD